MSDLNSFSVIGRITKDAELKMIGAKQTACAEFTLANNTGFGQYEKTSYVDVQLWGQAASGLVKYLTKGKQVAVQGEFVQNSWVDQNGVKHVQWRLSARGAQLLASPKGQGSAESEPAPDYNADGVEF